MKLLTRVKQLNKDELVYIGSKSAFFFIGYPDDFIAQEERLSKLWQDRFNTYHQTSIRSLELHEKNRPAEGTIIVRKMQDFPSRRIYEATIPYEKILKDWETKLHSLQGNVELNKKRCEKFQRFADRRVVEEYKKLNERDNIIICSGNEAANYWMYKEFLKYKGR